MASEFKNKIVKGSLWSFVENFAQLGIGTVFSIILARLLSPEDFGAVAMLSIFIALSNTIINGGFGTALVRKLDRTEQDNSTAFFFNIVLGVVCYLLLFFAAPFIAKFYCLPVLSPVLRVIALNLVFNSLCIVQHALLTIRMDFKTFAKITVYCNIITGAVAVFFAYRGWGIWALVFQSITSSFMRMCMLWLFAKWIPRAGFSKKSFSELFGFGSKILASGLLNTAYNNIYPLVIGKFFTPAQLGLFSRGQLFASVASDNITAVIERVTFPALSQIQNENERLETSYRRLIRLSVFIIFPTSLLLVVVASPLVEVLLTSKWSSCIVFLQIMCLSRMWMPIHALNLNLLKVKGRSDLFLRLEIIKKVLGVLMICITLPMGLVAMCWGELVSSIISLVINTHYTGKLINVGFIRQMLDITPTLIVSSAVAATIYVFQMLLDTSILKLVIGLVFGVLLYWLVVYLFRFPELKEVRSVFFADGR